MYRKSDTPLTSFDWAMALVYRPCTEEESRCPKGSLWDHPLVFTAPPQVAHDTCLDRVPAPCSERKMMNRQMNNAPFYQNRIGALSGNHLLHGEGAQISDSE